MKHVNKLRERKGLAIFILVVFSMIIGFVSASASTSIIYPCTPDSATGGCAAFEKAIMHPSDLLANKQESLTRFFETFAVASVVYFVLLSLFSYVMLIVIDEAQKQAVLAATEKKKKALEN